MRSRSVAFTLIELLAATTLCALMMIAVLAVTASLGRMHSEIRRAAGLQSSWRQGLGEIIRWDLSNATTLRGDNGTVVLESHGLLGPQTCAAVQHAGSVTYRVQRLAGRNWLVREQREARGAGSGEAPIVELICPDIATIWMGPSNGHPNRPLEPLAMMPQKLRIVIQPQDPRLGAIDQLMVLR